MRAFLIAAGLLLSACGTAVSAADTPVTDPPYPTSGTAVGTGLLTFPDEPKGQGPTYGVEMDCQHITIEFYDLKPGLRASASVDLGALVPFKSNQSSVTYYGKHDAWNVQLLNGNGRVIFAEGRTNETSC